MIGEIIERKPQGIIETEQNLSRNESNWKCFTDLSLVNMKKDKRKLKKKVKREEDIDKTSIKKEKGKPDINKKWKIQKKNNEGKAI